MAVASATVSDRSFDALEIRSRKRKCTDVTTAPNALMSKAATVGKRSATLNVCQVSSSCETPSVCTTLAEPPRTPHEAAAHVAEVMTVRSEREPVKLDVASNRLSSSMRALAPRIPAKVASLLHEKWTELDPHADKMLTWMEDAKVFREFPHGREQMIEHLRGTWAVLECWNQPKDLCRMGLFHSLYSRESFSFRYFDITKPESRQALTDLIGSEAERLVAEYCSSTDLLPAIYRFFNLDDMYPEPTTLKLGETLDPAGYDFKSRENGDETVHVAASDTAKHLLVFVADVMEQLSDCCTYGKIYGKKVSEKLFPGSGMPGFGMSYMSAMCRSARDWLDVVPPIFDGCTAELSLEAEWQARALYWEAMQSEGSKSAVELEELYRKASELNPYIGEPHVMLSQLLFNRQAYDEAAHHAACALDIFYQWATQWDKRRPWTHWVGFARLMHLQAVRAGQDASILPWQPLTSIASEGARQVTFLQDVVSGFHEVTEQQATAQP